VMVGMGVRFFVRWIGKKGGSCLNGNGGWMVGWLVGWLVELAGFTGAGKDSGIRVVKEGRTTVHIS
jgi:hypothetical protein